MKKKDLVPISLDAISPRGSLGLLALGAAGIKAWRAKRKEEEKDKKSQQ